VTEAYGRCVDERIDAGEHRRLAADIFQNARTSRRPPFDGSHELQHADHTCINPRTRCAPRKPAAPLTATVDALPQFPDVVIAHL
jgi:hypothetical protein